MRVRPFRSIGLATGLASIFFLFLLFIVSSPADAAFAPADAEDDCTQHGGLWYQTTSTCELGEWWLHSGQFVRIKAGETYEVNGTMTLTYGIGGPPPGFPQAASLQILGVLRTRRDLTVLGDIVNYGAMETFGSVYIQWDSWTNCIWPTDECYTLPIEGQIWNRGAMTQSGVMEVGHLLVNEDRLSNFGTIHANRQFDNRGVLLNAGMITVAGESFRNAGMIFNRGTHFIADGHHVDNTGTLSNTGRLVIDGQLNNWRILESSGEILNRGTLFNTGILSADAISNSGTILNLGVISATITGDGRVMDLQHRAWLPILYASAPQGGGVYSYAWRG